MTEERYDPFAGKEKVGKDDLAVYLRRVGRGLSCRIDVPILSLEDLKWAATVFSNLASELQQLAYKDERQELLRVMAGRYAMEGAKEELHNRNDRKGVVQKITRMRANPYARNPLRGNR